MPIIVNLRHLEAHNIRLEGELPPKELDIDSRDEVIQVTHPLRYNLEVQNLDDSLLVTGHLHLTLDCECVRCLKRLQYELDLPDWTSHLPLQGEDAVPVINDCVDLTATVREDILLEFPQHPLCDAECRGLPNPNGKPGKAKSSDQNESTSSAWAELNKLKL